MSPVHHEAAFGKAIVAARLADSWRLGSKLTAGTSWRSTPPSLFEFIGDPQVDEWNELLTHDGGDADAPSTGSPRRLDQAISNDGLLEVLRRASGTGSSNHPVVAQHRHDSTR